ncbi:TetR/AcrR family transcriptional regulator [Pandoraea apista]|uniref:TetR family transcriptional regulator n=1 Tax=Pandoraea apista TaxID=93218 RepID=A0A0B5FF34_9BURK|nr:TetR/AcrR family transcriptional regulator [Pandoraea apista]AJE99386.1 TetR family transcriptional regulator [Pandoraea apista]AKH73495.1 TetR family transcriptional regulator [Pandoraea apista]AKI62042.1 TetR family transcriptional regulator [Pandoraea apista]ALS63792.1 TetR family transcriptional regulator [Pandoraea apista]AVF40323.1 TetR/AcrR family transcriptional regulator [Pandoraea apista]
MTTPETKIKRDPERTRQRILAAAIEEFAERGSSGARVDSIARRADINERMLYYYFGNKDQLYLAVLEEVYGEFNRAEHALKLDVLAPLDAVAELAHFVWDYYAEHPELIQLINNENLHEAKSMRQSTEIRQQVSPIVELLAQTLKRGEASGEIRVGVDPVDLYVTISAMGYYVMSNRHTLSIVMGRDVMAADSRKTYSAFNTQMLLDSLRTR